MANAMSLHSPPGEIPRLQDALLAETMQRCEGRHPAYRSMLREMGLRASDIKSIVDLRRLPLTSKDEYVSAPERYVLETPAEPEPVEYLWDIAYTGGSTAQPTPIHQTGYDIQAIMLAQLRMAEIRGLSGEDRIANLFPFTGQAHGAWLRANHAAHALGASLWVGMNGANAAFPVTRRLPAVLTGLARFDPTVLWGVSSYLGHVADALESAGVRLPSLRLLAVSGEPCPPKAAESLRRQFAKIDSDVIVSNSFGASELQCGLVECAPGTGFHNPAPELFHFSAVDDEGLPVEDGTAGRLVLTHLDRRGTVLLRYVLGDLVALSSEPCDACGRSGGRIVSHQGRLGARTKVRGQLFDIRDLLAVLDAEEWLNTYQVRVRKSDPSEPSSLDELVVHYEATDTPKRREAEDELAELIRRATGIRPILERRERGSLLDESSKLKVVPFRDDRGEDFGAS